MVFHLHIPFNLFIIKKAITKLLWHSMLLSLYNDIKTNNYLHFLKNRAGILANQATASINNNNIGQIICNNVNSF